MAGNQKLLDAKAVAGRLGISVRLAQRHMHDRVIETIDVSGGGKQTLLRVRPEALEKFIKQRTRQPEDEERAPELRLIKPKQKYAKKLGGLYPRPVDGRIPKRPARGDGNAKRCDIDRSG